MVRLSRSRQRTSDDERQATSKRVLAAVLFVLSLIVIVQHIERSRTPGWVALRETSAIDEFYLKNFSYVHDFSGSNKQLKKPVDMSVLDGKVNFTAPSIDEYDADIEPMWQCNDPDAVSGRKKKLVFFGSFRSASVVVNALLQGYSDMCQAGAALIKFCQYVSLESLSHGNWANGEASRKRNICQMRRAISRDGSEIQGIESVNTSFVEANVDTLLGNIPLGVASTWKDDLGEPVEKQYVTFVRDPLHRYISGSLYIRQGLSLDESVDFIKSRVNAAVEQNLFYEKFSSSMITPLQNAHFEEYGFGLSYEESTNLSIANLVKENVMIGIVERMPESLEMLQYIIDQEGITDPMFEYFGKRDANGMTRVKKGNQSKRPTAEIVAELEKDEDFMTVIRHYLRYEYRIHEFALELHMRQYQSIQEQKLQASARSLLRS